MTEHGPLARWLATVAGDLELTVDADRVTRLVLDLARDVAHAVDRPAAPLTAYLLGLAAGAAEDPVAATERAAERIRELAQGWTAAE